MPALISSIALGALCSLAGFGIGYVMGRAHRMTRNHGPEESPPRRRSTGPSP